MIRSVVYLVIALACVGLANAQDARLAADLRQHNTGLLRSHHQDRALVARDEPAVGGLARANDLLSVCQQTQVTSLFVSVRSITGGARDAATEYRWRSLLAQAHRLGMRVFAICGDSGTVTDYGVLYDAVDKLMRFGAIGLPGEQFDGMLLDLPILSTLTGMAPPVPVAPVPATIGEAAPDQPAEVVDPRAGTGTSLAVPGNLTQVSELVRNLTLVDRVRGYLTERYPNTPFDLGASIPCWLETSVSFQGATKAASSQFVDLCDFLVAHNLPYNTTDVAQGASQLLAYAGSLRRPVLLRIELRPMVYDLPDLMTLFAMLDEVGGRPGMGGFLLDDWVHWQAMPAARPPGRPTRPTEPVRVDLPRARSKADANVPAPR
ncbi:MAG: hypothetical protein HZB16_17870 [Armatimonadetes bacterium]|nr:hypothetical protein [Armatimonadota bacterium]